MACEETVIITVYGHLKQIDKFTVKMMCDSDIEHYCNTVNDLKINDKFWVYARIISQDSYYTLDDIRRPDFERILKLDDELITKVMRKTDSQELSIALRSASAEIQDKIFKNFSAKAVNQIKEDMEYMGMQPKVRVAKAREKILNTVCLLTEKDKPEAAKRKKVSDDAIDRIVFSVHGSNKTIEKFSVNIIKDSIISSYRDTVNELNNNGSSWTYISCLSECAPYTLDDLLPPNFERILKLDDISIKRIIANIDDLHDLAMAIKNAPAQIQDKILKNADKKRDTIKKAIENSKALSETETKKAQQKILDLIRSLADLDALYPSDLI